MPIVFADLHLRRKSADVAFRVLDWIAEAAAERDRCVVFCGDFWHVRYQVDIDLLLRVHRVFDTWGDRGIHVDLIAGNHDQINTSGATVLESFAAHGSVTVWSEPGVRDMIGFVPYIKDQGVLLNAIEDVSGRADLVYGHFGVHGALMGPNRRASSEDGVRLEQGSADFVLGHYHKRQVGSGWEYVGSPYQIDFGEAGNVCGALYVPLQTGSASDREFIEIDVGAPKHYVIQWDPSEGADPPERPGSEIDRVRLDIRASSEMLISGKFKAALAKHGLEDAQVNVVPVSVDRRHKIELENGESLLDSAVRFAGERFGEDAPGDADRALEALRRWAL